MKALFKMDFDCGRMGNLEGVFIADTEDVEYLVNNKISVYFGEVLGKHSEISGCVAESEIKQITTDENVIKIVEEYGLNSGYNPFEYTLCTSETEDIPDNGVDWDDCTVQEYIDFMRKGIIPQYYEKDYKEWLSSQRRINSCKTIFQIGSSRWTLGMTFRTKSRTVRTTLILTESGMKEYIYLILFLIIGIVVGNRVFNHLHAWLGVTIISATIIFFIYKLIKTLKDEKTD